MPGRRRAPLHRIGRGLLRQRHVRKLLRDPRMRTARAPEVPVSRRSADGRLRVHRGLVQSATAPLRHRISVTRQLRTEPATPRSPKSMTVHETGSTPMAFGQLFEYCLYQFECGVWRKAVHNRAKCRLHGGAPASSGKTPLARIEERGKFPGIRQRWCTADLKRSPIEDARGRARAALR